MSFVRITKEGLKYFEWDSNIRSYEEIPVPTFLSKLRCSCQIESGVTIGDIFNAVERDKPLKDFLGDFSWCNVDAFHSEARRPTLSKSDLKYLEVYVYFEFGEGMVLGFHGIGTGEGMEDCPYSISFLPINEIADLEVRLNKNCPIMKDHKEIDTCEVSLSLLDVLSEIYFEISFYGSPAQRDEKSLELQDIVADIKSGEANLVPWEEIKPKLQ